MGMQTQSETNTARSELGGRRDDSPDEKVQKRGTQADAEDLAQLAAKKARHSSDELKWYKAKAVLKRLAQDDDDKDDKNAGLFTRVRSRLSGKSLSDLTAGGPYSESAEIY